MSLEGEVEGHGMRPVKETTSAANRIAVSKVSTAWDAAGNASEHAGSVRQARAPVVRKSATCRHHVP